MTCQQHLFRTLKRTPAKRFHPIVVNGYALSNNQRPSQSNLFRALKDEVGHVAMKKESEELRRIMSKTGLSEEDVRERSIYQRQLKKTQEGDKGPLQSYEKKFLKIARAIMKEKGMPIWSDAVIEEIKSVVKDAIIKDRDANPYYVHYSDYGYSEIYYHDFMTYVSMGKESGIDEIKIWNLISYQNKNNFIKTFMILSKKKKGKQ